MITVSATRLAKLAKDNACDRCFWLDANVKLPYQRFPGVFSTLDRAGKEAVNRWVEVRNLPPPWLLSLGAIKRFLKPPHYSKFFFTHGDLLVRGEADLIALFEDDSLLIGDLKTASYTEKQEELLPMYGAQLGCYALAAEATKMGTVSKLGLIYCQPISKGIDADVLRTDGYATRFDALAMGVNRNDQRIYDLCDRAYNILAGPVPSPSMDCEDCPKLDHIIHLIQGD